MTKIRNWFALLMPKSDPRPTTGLWRRTPRATWYRVLALHVDQATPGGMGLAR